MSELKYWTGCVELLKEPHILIAGTTGSGKSVYLNTLIYTAALQGSSFLFIDLKRVELAIYRGMDRTIEYTTEEEQVCPTLDRAINIMEDRYKKMKGYEYQGKDIYLVIDELADCLTVKGALQKIVKIGRLGRAAHVHLLCCTQDPSKKTLSAQLMQNFTSRVALRCFSPVESRQIIGIKGAENLPRYGRGIKRDADGIKRIDIPLTPREDIQTLVDAVSPRPAYL